MGNSSHSKIVGMGDAFFETNMGCKLTLKHVRHALDLRLNLMSGFAIDKQDYENHFDKRKWKLTKGLLVAAKWEACCTLYKTQGKVCNDELYAVDGALLELWHKRLEHMSEKGFQVLVRKFLIPLTKNESHLRVFGCKNEFQVLFQKMYGQEKMFRIPT